MSELPKDFKPMDPGRIHPTDPVELRYWCRELHCSEAELRRAVARVGEHVAEVRTALARRPGRS